mgnify:FL=1
MEIVITTTIKASAVQIYEAWLSSEKHSEMTGGKAEVTDKDGGAFTAWDEYISGKNIELIPNSKIVQSWRTVQFEDNEEDSQIEIQLIENNRVTELTLIHTKVPESGEHYRKGWETSYFAPMREYFDGL